MINPSSYNASEASSAETRSKTILDLRKPTTADGQIISWTAVKKILSDDANDKNEDDHDDGNQYPLDALDPTQRVFADMVLNWGDALVRCYKDVEHDAKPRDIPLLRTWLCGSAGSGKSTTMKTVVYHLRKKFAANRIPAKVELTAYTGVAAFNIGFGAKTTCSCFQIFPNATWTSELKGQKKKQLEQQWEQVELLIVDEISFVGRILFARMHHRLQQGRRAHFALTAQSPEDHQFGDVSIILVGDFGQLEPIDDFSLCELDCKYSNCPVKLRSAWNHAVTGSHLVKIFREAILLKRVHRSQEDMWWTESCLRLRNINDDTLQQIMDDYNIWRQHDLDRGHLNDEQKQHFENNAVWLCARCEDVGTRNGRKLAHLAEEGGTVIHQIHAVHSTRTTSKRSNDIARKSADAFGGLRTVVNLVVGCKIILTRNVAYHYGLANGTRGRLIGIVYSPGTNLGSFPEAIIVDVPDYTGPCFYPGEPTWVPILPMTDYKGSDSRTQFPLAAGFALTINKSQGLTIKEGVVINLQGTPKYKPAAKHGLPFVAFTRSESFAMTAFKCIPSLDEFLQGVNSEMLHKRRDFDKHLAKLHRQTMAKYSTMKTESAENKAHQKWKPPPRHKKDKGATCPACQRM